MVSVDLFEKMFFSVFAPKEHERILLLYDVPSESMVDSVSWKDRRVLVDEWYEMCEILGRRHGFFVESLCFPSTGKHNGPIPDELIDSLLDVNIIIALTEFSVTSSLASLVCLHADKIRAVSMPQAERRMMETVFSMDYSDVKRYAHGLKDFLQNATAALLRFSTGDELVVDLRNRVAGADDGDCTRPGCFINLPSGEGFCAPYEGVDDEINVFGKSRTDGMLPYVYCDEIVKLVVKENRIVDIVGNDKEIRELMWFFDKIPSRRNIAELGIGCNPQARVTGNFIEDEKAGVHIAFGMSRHLGGKIESDLHIDIVFAKDCPVFVESLILFSDEREVEIVKDGFVQYGLLA